jgi:hypothetical protein
MLSKGSTYFKEAAGIKKEIGQLTHAIPQAEITKDPRFNASP